MSARTPFFPQAGNAGGVDRPPTRNTNRPSETSVSGDNAPKLNTSGLSGLKKKNRGSLSGSTGGLSGTGSLNAQQIDASTITRPTTADPHAHQAQGKVGAGTPLKPRLSEGSMKAPHPPAFGALNNSHGNGGSARTSNNPFGNKSAFSRRESGSAPKIMAPVPIAPPTPILDGLAAFDATPAFSGFKTPALPGQNVANEAHISSGNDEQRQAQAHFRPPFTSGLSGDTSGSTNETYVEDGDDHDDSDTLVQSGNSNGKKDTSGILSGLNIGPRRVIIDSSGKAIGGTGAQYAERGQHEFVLPGHGINEHGRVFQQQGGGGGETPGGGQGGGGARQQIVGRKRNREQVDTSMQGSPYGGPDAKRMKTGKGPGSARGASSEAQTQENFFPRGQHNPHDQGHGRSADDLAASQESAGYEHAPSSGGLDRIMKLDVDEYIREHVDLYEQHVEKWTSCPLKEWMSGSDELAAKYMEMLDLAKEKMTEQLKFYASLETKFSNYGEILEDRKQSLEIARQRVLEESRNVLK